MLWLGMQIPITRVTSPLADEMIQRGGENGEVAAEQIRLIGDVFRLNDVIGSMLPSVFSGLSRDNLFNLMVATFAPGLAQGIDRHDLASVWVDALGDVSDPGSIGAIFGLGLVFFLVSTFLTVSWHVPLALSVARRSLAPIQVVRLVIRSWFRFVALIAMLTVFAMVVIVPVIIIAGVLLLMQINLAALVSIFLIMLGSLIAIYARFVLESIVLNDIGPLSALKRSAMISQTFFGPTVRFSIAVMLIATGALRLWDTMIPSPPGLPVAIILNSFLGTGIAIASLMFYHDRDRLIQKFTPARTDINQTPL